MTQKCNHFMDRFFTLRQVQEMFKISRATLWRWTAERGLKIVRVGNVKRICKCSSIATKRQYTWASRHPTPSMRVDEIRPSLYASSRQNRASQPISLCLARIANHVRNLLCLLRAQAYSKYPRERFLFWK